MDNKKLSEQCVEYCDIVEKYAETEDKIRSKILDIVQLFDRRAYTLVIYFLINDELQVIYNGAYCCDSETRDLSFPVKWLDLDNKKISKLVEAKKEELRKEIEKQKKKEQEQMEQEAERRERQEYERLKAKYGKEQQ